MTNPIEERSYQRPRRYVFAATLMMIITLLVLLFLL
jgi:hypothetical protein